MTGHPQLARTTSASATLAVMQARRAAAVRSRGPYTSSATSGRMRKQTAGLSTIHDRGSQRGQPLVQYRGVLRQGYFRLLDLRMPQLLPLGDDPTLIVSRAKRLQALAHRHFAVPKKDLALPTRPAPSRLRPLPV